MMTELNMMGSERFVSWFLEVKKTTTTLKGKTSLSEHYLLCLSPSLVFCKLINTVLMDGSYSVFSSAFCSAVSCFPWKELTVHLSIS